MKHKENTTNGLSILLNEVKGYSQAQAAWRFYNNENVEIAFLNNPIMGKGLESIEKACKTHALFAHDWSLINYRNHTAKYDCIETKRSNSTKAISKGYDLQSSLAISDITGEPIAPLVLNLKTSKHIFSTYNDTLGMDETHLGELSKRISYIHHDLSLQKIPVHIIDREADSAGFLRTLREDDFYIIRAVDERRVEYNGESITQKELSKKIALGLYVKTISYRKKRVKVYVNSANIRITRDAYRKETDPHGNVRHVRTKGKALEVRFVVERLVDADNNVVATWLLLTNLGEDVEDKTVGLWYYYRWNIESYFKLLKSSGMNAEKWQQERAEAIFRRLLIASYACVLVWQIEHTNHRNMHKIKTFLVQLSGRLIARGKTSTSPALLAGIWNFFSMMDILELYDTDKLFSMKQELNAFWGMDF